MDGNHPKRRKDKYNPYTIGTTEDGRHWLSFSDGQGNRHHFEISAAVFALFDSFELDDLSYLNEVDRHYEQSELTEASLYDRAVHRPATVEESALQSMEYAQLHRAISGLPEIQNNVGNKHSPTVIIASITSKTGVKAKLPTHYYIDAEDGLELPSIVLLEQLRTVDKRRLGNFIGHLSEKHICGINHALAVSIGLIESVPKKLILCLCSTCADNFYGTGAYYLRRIDPLQVAKDTCTYCNQRKGYDYELVPKKR